MKNKAKYLKVASSIKAQIQQLKLEVKDKKSREYDPGVANFVKALVSTKNVEFLNASAISQQKRILKYFQEISQRLTVGEARAKLGVMHLPARILNLRRMGYKIDLFWFKERDSLGIYHRNGVYLYRGFEGGEPHE